MRLAWIARPFGLSLLMLALGGCGGPSFSLAGGPDGSAGDAKPRMDTGANKDVGARESGTNDSGSGDAAADAKADTSGACAPLAATATDVYVDKKTTAATPTGSQACPFGTILEGTAAAATLTANSTVTVHVKGYVPAVTYAETGEVTVASNVDLLGDGAALVVLSASGPCGAGTCAVLVSGGGVLDGFTVTSLQGDGIRVNGGPPLATVRNVTATGSKGDGVLALGGIELGPSAILDKNGAAGLESPTTGSGRLHVIGTLNAFDDNVGNGIDISGAAWLDFEGGSTSGNQQGIRLAGATAVGSSHTITSLSAKRNTGPGGVVAYSGQSITMRSSTLLANAGAGLYYEYANGSTLDIDGATGSNTFGTSAVGNNTAAGLELCGTAVGSVGPTVNATDDVWAVCPPKQTVVVCGSPSAGYSDVLYASTVSGLPPVTDPGCATTP